MHSRISRLALLFTAGLATTIATTLSTTAVAAPHGAAQIFHGRIPTAAGTSAVLPENASNETLVSLTRAVLAERSPASVHAELHVARSVRMRTGSRVVRLEQTHMGLPVAKGGATVTFGSDGVARLVGAQIIEDLPTDITPSIDLAAVTDLASTLVGRPISASDARLVIWDAGNGPFVAWVTYTRPTVVFPDAPVLVIDAKTGELVQSFDARSFDRKAKMYEANPVKTPDLIDITLDLPAASTNLTSDLIFSRNCIDQHTKKSFQGFQVHSCELLQTAVADANGDFFIPVAGDTEPEDPFSELSIFHHVSRAYTFYRNFQSDFVVQDSAIDTISNLRLPDGYTSLDLAKMQDTSLPLVPFQNAFFSPADPIFSSVFGIQGGAMFFGQGPNRDYSYDGDVIYHEFTHSVVNVTLKLVGTAHHDDLGVSHSPGGMNEGLADFFSSAIAGDPDVGEYASKDFAPNLTAIRSLTNPDKCPSEIGGEVHQDATLFSGGLWDVRKTLSTADQAVYDASIFEAMNSAPNGDLGYEDFAKIVVSALEASTLGASVADAQTAAFTARGVLPRCNRILDAPLDTALKGPKDLQNLWFALGTTTAGLKAPLGYAPGIVQFHAPLPEGSTSLTVTATKVDTGGGSNPLGPQQTPFGPKLIVRFGADPITFSYGPYAVSSDAVTADFTGSTSLTATVTVPAGATSAYVMIGNTGEADGAYTSVKLSAEGTPPATGGAAGAGATGGTGGTDTAGTAGDLGTAGTGAIAGTAGTSGASGASATKAAPTSDDSGCGCRVPTSSSSTSTTGMGILALLGLVAMRRRK